MIVNIKVDRHFLVTQQPTTTMLFQFESRPVFPLPSVTTKYLLLWKPSVLNTELPDLLFDDKMSFQTLLANQLLLKEQMEPDTRSFTIKNNSFDISQTGSPISVYPIMITDENRVHPCLTTCVQMRIRKSTSITVALYYINRTDIRYVINIIKYIIECAVDVQIQAIQQKGRELRNLPYLSKRLQGNSDVLSIISGFLVKGTPRKELERMESLKATLNAEMERPMIREGKSIM